MEVPDNFSVPNISPGSNKRRVVYTVSFGDYDLISDIDCRWDCDFVCITDSKSHAPRGWKIIYIDIVNDEQYALLNRFYKILPHLFLRQYEASLYIDGHVRLKRDPTELFEKYLNDYKIAMPRHFDRSCAYAEAIYCVNTGLLKEIDVNKQLKEYRLEGFPEQYGLTENGVMLRRHNDSDVISSMEQWWHEYYTKARRDQISFSYVRWKNNITVGTVAEGPRLSGKYFDLTPHKARRMSILRRLSWHISTHKFRTPIFRLLDAMLTAITRAIHRIR